MRRSSSPQLRPGLQSEIIDELTPRVPKRGQGVGLAPRSVQGKHVRGMQTLAEGMLGNELLELRHQFGAASARELGLDALLDRPQAPLLQLPQLAIGEWLVDQVRESRAAPESQSLR